jgi:hypothetical protein
MSTIDLSLSNKILYAGCEITEVGGRATLATPPSEATNLVGRNAQLIVDATPQEERGEVVLTGPMAVWSYMVVFHVVLHKFSKVYYDDGRSGKVLIAQH